MHILTWSVTYRRYKGEVGVDLRVVNFSNESGSGSNLLWGVLDEVLGDLRGRCVRFAINHQGGDSGVGVL